MGLDFCLKHDPEAAKKTKTKQNQESWVVLCTVCSVWVSVPVRDMGHQRCVVMAAEFTMFPLQMNHSGSPLPGDLGQLVLSCSEHDYRVHIFPNAPIFGVKHSLFCTTAPNGRARSEYTLSKTRLKSNRFSWLKWLKGNWQLGWNVISFCCEN